MTNWILMPVHNALPLVRDAVESALAQDVGDVKVLAIDNDSTDGTRHYLDSLYPRVWTIHFKPQKGVSYAWNKGLRAIFNTGVEGALVVNSDVRLRPDTYRILQGDGGGFVTCVGTSDGALFPGGPPTGQRRPHPDFSCFYIRGEVWEKVGKFDETMVSWCSDGDYHLRMERAGLRAYCLDLPFFHVASGTLKNSSLREKEALEAQAGRDREAFKRKWGVEMGSTSYYKLFEGTK